jgi:hypothetical protein
MLDIVRAWLNGTREFYAGIALYEKLQHDPKILSVLKKNGKTEWGYKKLQEELLRICNELKANITPEQRATEKILHSITLDTSKKITAKTNESPSSCANPYLYAVCKKEADVLYKQIMNNRALLFADIRSEVFFNVNPPDKVAKRATLALGIVKGYQKVSELYDKADYVFRVGSLPVEYQETFIQDKYNSLPDELVKSTLDNLRKNYNKKKKLEPTPERIASLQEHEENIKKLEARWHSLKPTH